MLDHERSASLGFGEQSSQDLPVLVPYAKYRKIRLRERRESLAQGFVHDRFQRIARLAYLFPQLRGNIIIQCECRAHIKMLAKQ